jgi:hypothetical protein
MSSTPASVTPADLKDLNPSIGRTSRLMALQGRRGAAGKAGEELDA